MGLGTIGFAQAYSRKKPDLLLVLGDRFEMHAAVVAAIPFKIPVAHIHGGELTFGAMDDAFRHSITKMSHLHFVSTDEYARRIEKMGEEPWRVTVSGAPGLDNLRSLRLLDRANFARRFGIRLPKNFLLVTYHPVTLENEDPARRFRTLLSALESAGHAMLFTMANADTGGHAINKMIRDHVASHRSAQFFHSTQLAQFIDHAMRCRRIKLARIRLRQPHDVACKLDACRLHPQTNAKVRNLFLARIPS